jgi:hypothetical protein
MVVDVVVVVTNGKAAWKRRGVLTLNLEEALVVVEVGVDRKG